MKNEQLQPQNCEGGEIQSMRFKILTVKETLGNAAALEQENADKQKDSVRRLYHNTRCKCYLECLQLINKTLE